MSSLVLQVVHIESALEEVVDYVSPCPSAGQVEVRSIELHLALIRCIRLQLLVGIIESDHVFGKRHSHGKAALAVVLLDANLQLYYHVVPGFVRLLLAVEANFPLSAMKQKQGCRLRSIGLTYAY